MRKIFLSYDYLFSLAIVISIVNIISYRRNCLLRQHAGQLTPIHCERKMIKNRSDSERVRNLNIYWKFDISHLFFYYGNILSLDIQIVSFY